ncbi:hypothetical protein [Rhizobium redzepovicii]|uniref:hypothetical protein n=1 Tax=Rhizobium redzepovicii TaxID=2867518 RepID=UPI002870F80E|nr:hypothetical protein [Rhizobium redzepovicii]MDR9781588.1 hypothetical protein [Rhizobium redzepovicii]
MDGWLKGLIAVTCLAVIGGIGYFILADRNDRQKAVNVDRQQVDAAYCRERLSQIRSGKLSADDIPVVDNCVLNSLLKQSDVIDAFQAGSQRRG